LKQSLALFAFAALLGTSVASAQDAPPSDPCGVRPKGNTEASKNFFTFGQFDKELRSALATQDALAMAFLVQFPLLVNDESGTISINNAGALKAHFQEVFTSAVRKTILDDKSNSFECNVEGIGYASGVIWVEPSPRGYAIKTVNRDAPSFPKRNPIVPHTEYVCQTQSHRIVIEKTADGALRYRSWNRPKLVTEAPDLEIARGKQTFEGSDVCAVPVWTFTSGAAVYTVGGALGCYDSNHPPPEGATGDLNVTIAGKSVSNAWCY
jgi:hypothetical protein